MSYLSRRSLLLVCGMWLAVGCADSGGTSRPSDTTLVDTVTDAVTADTTVADTRDALTAPDTAPDTADVTAPSDVPAPDVAPDSATEDTALVDMTEDTIPDLDTSVEDVTDADGLAPGEHTVELLVTDANDVLSSYLMDPAAGAWNIFSGDTIYWGRRSPEPHVSFHTAMRFMEVGIPAGAEVLEATLSITPHNAVDKSHQLCLNVYAEREASSDPFDPADYTSGRPDQRLKTSAFIDRWITRCVQSCDPNIEYDCVQREADCWDPAVRYEVPKDLSALVQEVIDLPGWQTGNPLTLFVVNSAGDSSYDLGKYNDHRIVMGFDPTTASDAPRLTVRFRVP